MIEITGNLWDFYNQVPICITTNGTVKKNGEAVLGRGCAKEAKDRFPTLPLELGNLLRTTGNQVYFLEDFALTVFPVKHNWFEEADINLIAKSCQELVSIADQRGWTKVIVPRPGCGNGRLNWVDVQPILSKYLDNRFHIISPT